MTNPPPSYQLVQGDRFNLTLGVVIAVVLAACKDIRGLSPFARLQLRAYTVWNLAFLGVRVAFNQAQWDSFLAVNSFGIACGFRTAMCQGIGENMRKKLAAQLAHDGLDLPQWQVGAASTLYSVSLHLCASALHLCSAPSAPSVSAVFLGRPRHPHAAAARAHHRAGAPCRASAPYGAWLPAESTTRPLS